MNESKPENDRLREELVAYLDGELDAENRQRVERRLRDDAAYREQLSALQQSWDLLDALPRAATDQRLTETTIAMVAKQQQRRTSIAKPPVDRRWQVSLMIAALAGLIGFAAIHIPMRLVRNRQLRDLPLAQNLEMYRYAESIEFLEMLHEEGVFVATEEDDAF